MFNKDFGKKSSGLLNDDFLSSPSVEIETKSCCLKLTNKATFSGNAVNTTVTPVWTVNPQAEVKGDFKSNGDLGATVTLKPDFADKRFKITSACVFGKKNSANVAVDYTYSKGTVSTKFNFPNAKLVCPTVDAGFVFKKDQYAVGTMASFKPDAKELDKAEVNVEVAKNNQIISVKGCFTGAGDRGGSLSYWRSINDSTSFAGKVSYCEDEFNSSFGFSRRLDNSSEGKIVVRSAGAVCLGFSKSLSPASKLKVGTTVDVFKMTHETGFSFSYSN